MADKSLRARLKRLFSTNVIVRHAGGRTLKVADTNRVQAINQDMTDRFTKLYNNMSPMGWGTKNNTLASSQRVGLFQDYESMDNDSILSSALDIYADESTMRSEYGEILNIRSDSDNIHDILHNLYYDVLNIEFNLWPWIRNMCKYGDFFLKLDIHEKYGVTNVVPLSAYDVTRSEGDDPENPYYVKFIIENGQDRHTVRMNPNNNELENYEVAHFRLLSDSNMIPYGKSMIEGARKSWKQLILMEDAMLIHRIMRAPEKRIFKIDIGNIPPNEVDNYMQRIINKMKKAPVIDKDTGDYNLKYNVQNITEDFFLPVRGGDSGTEIDTAAGLTFEAVEDIEYLRNKMLAALKIPKAFLGYEEEVNAKATLAAEDVRFARTIERVQRIVVSELTKIGIIHLYAQGYQDADLVNFELGLTNPSMIYEQEKLELWSTKIDLAANMKDNKLLPTEFMYDEIFGFTAQEKKKVREQLVEDQKRMFRYESIEQEGADPAAEGSSGEDDFGEDDFGDSMARTGTELGPEGGSPEGGWEGAGRPKRPPKFGKDGSARGRDPLGAHDMKKGASTLALAHLDKLKKSLGNSGLQLLKETTALDEEYKREVKDTLDNNDK